MHLHVIAGLALATVGVLTLLVARVGLTAWTAADRRFLGDVGAVMMLAGAGLAVTPPG